jgi:hypothetical protein
MMSAIMRDPISTAILEEIRIVLRFPPGGLFISLVEDIKY